MNSSKLGAEVRSMTLEKAYNKPWKFLDWRFCCSCSEKYFFQQVCIKKAPNQFSFSISASLWTSQKRPQDRWMGNWVSRNWKNSNYCKEGTWGKVKKANVITCSYYVLSKSGSVIWIFAPIQQGHWGNWNNHVLLWIRFILNWKQKVCLQQPTTFCLSNSNIDNKNSIFDSHLMYCEVDSLKHR